MPEMPEWFGSGGPVMWPLLFCSILVSTVVLERVWFWLRERRRLRPRIVEAVLDSAKRGEVEQAAQMAGIGPDAALHMLEAGLQDLPLAPTSALEGAAKRDLERMNRGLHALDTMITVSPMLGILGTVMGVIQSFELLGAAGAQDPRAVVGGIAEALITTATGMAIAIAALLPYNFFSALRRKQAVRLEEVGRRFERICERSGLVDSCAGSIEESVEAQAAASDAVLLSAAERERRGKVAGRATQ